MKQLLLWSKGWDAEEGFVGVPGLASAVVAVAWNKGRGSKNAGEALTPAWLVAGGPRMSMVHHPKGDFSRPDPTPKLIPKIFHQTYMTSSVPPAVQPLMESWRIQNPDWNFRFYDDEACLDFVEREFPEYLDAYKGLPKNVERSDFFRYPTGPLPSRMGEIGAARENNDSWWLMISPLFALYQQEPVSQLKSICISISTPMEIL